MSHSGHSSSFQFKKKNFFFVPTRENPNDNARLIRFCKIDVITPVCFFFQGLAKKGLESTHFFFFFSVSSFLTFLLFSPYSFYSPFPIYKKKKLCHIVALNEMSSWVT